MMNGVGKEWDVFISHASEDKESLVRPLAAELRRFGLSVWYDEFSLGLGDSLSRSIDRGLASSRFGLVVISPYFIAKRWPEYELRGLVAREMQGSKVILPIWYGVTRDQVLAFSPPLADKIALVTAGLDIANITLKIVQVVRPDLYADHPQAVSERLNVLALGAVEIAVLEELRGKPDVEWTPRLIEQSIKQNKPHLRRLAATIPSAVRALVDAGYLESEGGRLSVTTMAIEYYRRSRRQ